MFPILAFSLLRSHVGCLCLQAFLPITRPAMVMHDGCNKDAIRLYFVKNRERKAGYQSLPDILSVDWTCFGELFRCGVLSLRLPIGSPGQTPPIFPHRIAPTLSFPGALRDGRSPSSIESFSRSCEGFVGIDALNPPAAKFFKSSLSFRKP